ncbi:hypothetical protein LTR85_010813 [Meristemomyces frigidus]|nr:hypothetical protein LTR85_010813 [Meristemomyces frigidus]
MHPPKPESLAPLTPPNSNGALDTYIAFLATFSKPQKPIQSLTTIDRLHGFSEMAAVPNASNPAFPLHYPAARTALLLLDFQSFIISMCGSAGEDATANAALVRKWALEQGIMVLHSIVDINGEPAPNVKRRLRLTTMLATIKQSSPEAAEEAIQLAFAEQPNEHLVLKAPGVVSGLKSRGARELLAEHDIKSLIICGLSTSGAVLRTAVPATDDNFVVTVVSDACADPKAELHEILLEQVLSTRAHVVVAEEVVQWQMGSARANSGSEVAQA